MFVPLKRLSFLLAVLCLAATAQAESIDYSGWWWDSAQSGTGYSLEVQCDKAYLVWYAYEADGRNTWLSSVLDVNGDTMSGELWSFTGWPLEAGYDGSEVSPAENLGTVILDFSDRNTGNITYAPAGGGENVVRTLERRLTGAPDPRNLNGWWWDVNQPGVGWFLEARNAYALGNILSVGWYNYRALAKRSGGLPRFYITWENFKPTDTHYEAALLDYAGGQTLTGPYVAPEITGSPGDLILNIPADFDGTPDIDPDDGPALDFSLDDHDYHLTRFTIPGSHCPPDCTPKMLTYYPYSGVTEGSVIVGAKFQTLCGSHIDLSSAAMTLNGEPVPYGALIISNPDADPSQVEIRYVAEFVYPSEYDIKISVADVYGNQNFVEWRLSLGIINYRK